MTLRIELHDHLDAWITQFNSAMLCLMPILKSIKPSGN